jgi:RNA polymerase sigma-70 factor (ECF subfamily)
MVRTTPEPGPEQASPAPTAPAGPRPGAAGTLGVSEVYERYFGYVVRLLSHLGVNADLLEDATQDVFLVVHAKLHDFDGRAAITTWLSAIAFRVAHRYRARQRRDFRHETDEQLSQHVSPEPDAHAHDRLQVARQALDALDEPKREVFVLSEIQQLTAPEIASITGVPLNTVYSRLRVAKQTFAAALHRLSLRGGSR